MFADSPLVRLVWQIVWLLGASRIKLPACFLSGRKGVLYCHRLPPDRVWRVIIFRGDERPEMP